MITDETEVSTNWKEDEVLDWLAMMDRQGLAVPLGEMERILQEAPAAVRQTEEYHYLRGLHDGRFLNEELKSGVKTQASVGHVTQKNNSSSERPFQWENIEEGMREQEVKAHRITFK